MTEPTQVAGEKQVTADVTVQKSQRLVSYKTKLLFIDLQRKGEVVTSVQPPTITQAGMLQFVLEDRLVAFPLMHIFRMETEQLDVIEPSKLIVSSK